MGKHNICHCKCGCTDKCGIPSMDDLTIMYAMGVDTSNAFLCENCLNGKHKAKSSENPLDALKRRLANGEITSDEYYRLKSIMEND